MNRCLPPVGSPHGGRGSWARTADVHLVPATVIVVSEGEAATHEKRGEPWWQQVVDDEPRGGPGPPLSSMKLLVSITEPLCIGVNACITYHWRYNGHSCYDVQDKWLYDHFI